MAAAAVAVPGVALAQQGPVTQPEPVEIPIGTEANTPIAPISNVVPRRLGPESIRLTIGTWHLGALKPGEKPKPRKQRTAPTKSWRHTFGAERTTAQWRKLDTGGFDADIIALQGVENVRTASQLFTARRYRIVTSRQLLARSDVDSSGFAVFRADAPATTAVAFRRRRAVRVAGFRHFLPKTSDPELEPPAITALRLRIYRKMLWVASADRPSACRDDAAAEACRRHDDVVNAFVAWSGQNIAKPDTWLLLMGQWPDGVVKGLDLAGLKERHTIAADVACTPAPSPMRLFGPASEEAGASELANAATAEANPCAATAELTLKLR